MACNVVVGDVLAQVCVALGNAGVEGCRVGEVLHAGVGSGWQPPEAATRAAGACEARGQLRNFFNACCEIYGGWQSTSNNSKMHTKQVSGQFVYVWCCRLVVVFV